MPVISRSGPATAEALWQLRSQGLYMDLADGLEMGSPYLHLHSPDLALSRGGSLRCSSSPLSESANLRKFLSKEIYIVLISEWLACCRCNAWITVILGSLYESFTDCVYLSGCLTAINFKELNYAFHLTMKMYIYIYIYIYK